MPISSGTAVLDALAPLSDVLAGNGDARLPVPRGDANEIARLTNAFEPRTEIDDRAALVVATSGTTGVPKGAMQSAAALNASIKATHEVLGGPGNWLLALPAHHIAGLQVLLRASSVGHVPMVIDVANGFNPHDLVNAAAAMIGSRRYTSLVPTQLHKVLDHPEATAALCEFDAVLVGGGATPTRLRERAMAAGVKLVRTYGMSETCGGCVYDGKALPGVRIRIDQSDSDGIGRVVLGGPMVALGYRNRPGHPAFTGAPDEPLRWFRTDDLGVLENGVLRIVGRADEAISTGGLTVIPQVVEEVLLANPAVADCAVVGLADERLGEQIVAVVVPTDAGAVNARELVALVEEKLGRHAAPRRVVVVDDLPRRGPGKVDRIGVRERLRGTDQIT